MQCGGYVATTGGDAFALAAGHPEQAPLALQVFPAPQGEGFPC